LSWRTPNLASRPFRNLRPVRRLSITLGAAAVALTAWNVVSYVRVGSGSEAKRTEIARLEEETATSRARLTTLEQDLAARHLAAENRRAEYLNRQIAQRTFAWNELFDRLGEVLPDGVRLRSVSPSLRESRRPAAEPEAPRRAVALSIQAQATDDESMLQFVDRLFAHPAFAGPNLSRESRQRGGNIAFSLTVVFYPESER